MARLYLCLCFCTHVEKFLLGVNPRSRHVGHVICEMFSIGPSDPLCPPLSWGWGGQPTFVPMDCINEFPSPLASCWMQPVRGKGWGVEESDVRAFMLLALILLGLERWLHSSLSLRLLLLGFCGSGDHSFFILLGIVIKFPEFPCYRYPCCLSFRDPYPCFRK